jgi:hypothetical protein
MYKKTEEKKKRKERKRRGKKGEKGKTPPTAVTITWLLHGASSDNQTKRKYEEKVSLRGAAKRGFPGETLLSGRHRAEKGATVERIRCTTEVHAVALFSVFRRIAAKFTEAVKNDAVYAYMERTKS